MPWTLAHPAAVLPLRRWCPAWLSLGALVAGSMAPDLGYYIGRNDLSEAAHFSPVGWFTVAMPFGLVLLAAWRIAGRAVIALLPQPHRAALLSINAPPTLPGWRAMASILASLLLGVLTHVAWDSFTHDRGYFVLHVHALRIALFTFDRRTIEVHNLLQHLSSVIGATCLLVAYRRFLRRATPSPTSADARAERLRWWLLGALALVSIAWAIPTAYVEATPRWRTIVALWIVRSVVDATNAFAVLVLAAAFVLAAVRFLRHRASSP